MAKPIIVIVGRPNVGKSTMFNKIIGRSVAIVEDTPGVTRDLNYMDTSWEGRPFVLVDTGGFYPKHDDNIFVQIKEQALFAIDEADIIIHLLDGKEGQNPYDMDLVKVLRTSGKKVFWAVNKIDADVREDRMIDFYSLGLDNVMPVSATTGYGLEELMAKITDEFAEGEEEEIDFPKVAIVGRPNVGKSTIVNALLGKKRQLVSPIPGTTRDAVDTICSYYKRNYLLIDTAGIRRKDKRGYSIERFAMVRTQRSIDRAEVAIIMVDATTGFVSDDQRIAGMVHEQGRSAIFVFNKWDLVEDPDKTYKELVGSMNRRIFFFKGAPTLTTSGLERKRITKLYAIIDKVIEDRKARISTSELNRFAATISIPPYKGRPVKIFYITQYTSNPPGFALFTNQPDGIKDFHVRHIESRIREAYGFAGTPIRIKIKSR